MVKDRVLENIHLDYKRSSAADPSRPVEIAKDVSSFANSDGGVLIYGVEEEHGLPVRIDEGVDPAKCSKERFEDIITSHITPRVDDVRITPFYADSGGAIFVVQVAKSFEARIRSQITSITSATISNRLPWRTTRSTM